MKFRAIPFLLPITLIVMSCSNPKHRNLEITNSYFDRILHEGDNAKLTLFLSQMPKGGDLHHHYSGALYVESFLDWAARQNLGIDPNTYKLGTSGTTITIDSLKKNDALYRKVTEEWSDMDFYNNFHIQNPPDQHFFNTFGFFGTLASQNYRAGLADIKDEARKENVQYIETMLSYPRVQAPFGKRLPDSLEYFENQRDTTHLYQLLQAISQSIKNEPGYDQSITAFVDTVHSLHAGIDDSNFTMRFQVYGVRTLPPANVFATLFGCFDAVTRDKSSLLVGVNIVAPENNIVSMRDYWLHMQMFRFLEKKFPNVKTDLHAGELCLGMVKPQDLTWHIHDAVFVANACRIGHGVDIPYETEAPEILGKMKKDSIAVEINLTSNEFILGVKGNDHPVNLYYDSGVPIVISTDDAGVSRNNLSNEYVLLASRYHYSYSRIKSIVFNSIRYSFLSQGEKRIQEEKLTKRFEAFEAETAREK